MSILLNDIYYSSWGYDQTNISYYQVVKVTAKSATLRKIDGERVQVGNDFSSKVVPILNKFDLHYPEALLRRMQDSDRGINFKIEHHEYAYKWDGKPKTETYTG
jgi:hypothetical protein